MFGLDSFASHAYADVQLRDRYFPQEPKIAQLLDSATLSQVQAFSPVDLTIGQALEPVTGFGDNVFKTLFDQLRDSPTAKREYLIHIQPFKLNEENPST